MNKCIKQNWKIFNQIRLKPIQIEMPDKYSEIPDQWAEDIWNHLVNDDLHRHLCYNRKGKGTNKYTITLWSDDTYLYLVQVIRTEYNTDSVTIMLLTNTEDNLNDAKAISKMIHRDINKFLTESINNVKQFNDLTAKVDGEA